MFFHKLAQVELLDYISALLSAEHLYNIFCKIIEEPFDLRDKCCIIGAYQAC